MTLRTKITALLLVIVGAYIAIDYGIQRFIMYPSFVALEREEAITDLERTEQAIEREIDHLSTLCFDWSAWTDTFEYVHGRQPEYHEANLANAEWFTDIDLDVICFLRPDGAVHWRNIQDTDGNAIDLAAFPEDRLDSNHPALGVTAEAESAVTGIMRTEIGPLLIAARPILTSEYEGPMAGVLVMGRFLDETAVERLVEQTQVDVRIWLLGDDSIPSQDRLAATSSAESGAPTVEERSDDELVITSVLPDLTNTPALVVNTRIPRDITARGSVAMTFATYSLIAAGVIIAVVLLHALQRIVVGPVSRLTQHATAIGKSNDLTRRVELHRSDEIGTLAGEFDNMVQKLSDSQNQLVSISRHAGMAEVATGVLHNIGNVLTNVTVLASSISRHASGMRVEGLGKAVDMLTEHKDDLPHFLSEDDKGRQLPGYLAGLSQHMTGQMRSMQDDLAALAESINHVTEILAAQQTLAQPREVLEVASVTELANSALTIVEASMTRHDVTVVRELDSLPSTMIDRGKMLQILVNLLTNAKDATKGMPVGQRQVTIRVTRVDEGQVRFEIVDSGVGIAPENLARIFGEGFTTREDGHGLGLHYAAIAAKELGGSLAVHSDGLGKGATFTLDIPLKAVEASIAA